MAKNEKKVIVFIVEGKSDEAALGTIMEEYFGSDEVRFVVVRGDITSDSRVSKTSIVKNINDMLDEVRKKYRYAKGDFLRIIHITDTDGAFIEDDKVVEAAVDSIQYYENRMETNDVNATLQRNHHKAEILLKMRKTPKINGIPYKIYYNSCNLEHVLYNELRDFSGEEKMRMADEFAEKYEGNISGFIEFICQVAASGTYQKTWDYIEKENRSTKRYTNMNLIFQ